MSPTPPFPCRVGALILAAGKGTRMHSDTPKVLQGILEEPMLRYVYDALAHVGLDRVRAVVGHGSEQIRAAFPEKAQSFILQAEQLGTGHALQTAWPAVLAGALDYLLVINGDTPLIEARAIRELLEQAIQEQADLAFMTLTLADPGAFGRVLRRNGQALAIVEAREYNPIEHGPEPSEINAGVYCLRAAAMAPLTPLLSSNNAGGEIYITDLVGLAVGQGLAVYGHNRGNDPSLLGINTPEELVRSEEYIRARIVAAHLRNGVIIRNPDAVRLGPDVTLAQGADITGPCELYGKTSVARGARIASHCRITDAVIDAGAVVRSFCHIENAHIGPDAVVGPYARLRPGAELEAKAQVGNFVEMKKSRLGKAAKANHLTYLGDAEIGPGANIGAGTITCNYDGKNKHATHIGAGAFIGSNSALVAPVTIGDEAVVGAGSVITKDVPQGALALTRPPQRTLPRRKKNS